jgi:PAS domain S-box-containing protein
MREPHLEGKAQTNMNLRLKFTILLGLVIAITVALATSTVYWIAREQLEKAAAERLQQTAWLVSTQIEQRFSALLRSIEVWAQNPMVQEAILHPHSPSEIEPLNRLFADIVKGDEILQSFNLYDPQAAIIASSIPEPVGFQIAQDVVQNREDFRAALIGDHVIKGPFMALSSGRPVISLSVPVLRQGRVVGVLRPIVDLANFNQQFLKPLTTSQEGRVFIFAPNLDAQDKQKPLDPTLVIHAPYISQDIPDIPEMLQDKRGVVTYKSLGVSRSGAFQWMDKPHALVVVELPLEEVLAPIRYIQYAAIAVAVMMLGVIWLSAGLAIRPLLANLRKCLAFVRAIRDGHMETRIEVKGHDDVGELAYGLNEMAERVQAQHAELQESEMKYRSIFETSVEGIFQTTEDGRFLAANPALAGILGVDSPAALYTYRVDQFYADPKQRTAIMNLLKQERKLSRYELSVKRLDGEIRRCLIHAHVQLDEAGRIVVMQGIMHDVTQERQAEAARKHAERAERLAVEARFQALRYQVNPHFLFNVLNTIDVLSRKTPVRIPYLLQQLSSYLRYTLKPKAAMTSKLDEEIQSIKAYLAVEQIRFHRHLEVAYDIAPDAAHVILPDMLLQPLVENAVKYGMRTSGIPMKLVIAAGIEDGRLSISVRNTGSWVTEDAYRPERPGIGLANLRERLDIFYDRDFSFETSEKEGWVIIAIRLPLTPSHPFSISQ